MSKHTDKVYKTGANRRVLDFLPDNIDTLLDIGCGTGGLCCQLQTMGIEADGITFSQEEVSAASGYCRKVWQYDLEHGLPDLERRYQVIVLSHVLEHIADPGPLMRDLDKVLAADGMVICAIPNMLFLYNRLKLLLGRVEYEQYGLMDYTHIRWYTRKTLLDLFAEHGYESTAFQATGNLPMGPVRKMLGTRISSRLDSMIVGRFPGLLAWEFAYCFSRTTRNGQQ